MEPNKETTKPVDIHEKYHNNPSKHLGCCAFTECRSTYDKDIYILTGRRTSHGRTKAKLHKG